MKNNINKHIVTGENHVRDLLSKLEKLAGDAIVFLVDDNEKLIGSITDGDIRRGLIRGLHLDSPIEEFANKSTKSLLINTYNAQTLYDYRKNKYKIVPVIDQQRKIVDLINFRHQHSILPLHALIMAGGEGRRLRPLTLETPKPLLRVAGKPIIEYNIDRLKSFGIYHLVISINYLGEQIENYFGDGSSKDMAITYVRETKPLGTLGSAGLVEEYHDDYILVMNSDVLTTIDFEKMFNDFIESQADISVATTPYKVEVPYGVIETSGNDIVGLKEKPTYTYYSNAGIYMMKKSLLNYIPKGQFYNATDLLTDAIKEDLKVVHYTIRDYWLDIGKPKDFDQAQKDIQYLNL